MHIYLHSLIYSPCTDLTDLWPKGVLGTKGKAPAAIDTMVCVINFVLCIKICFCNYRIGTEAGAGAGPGPVAVARADKVQRFILKNSDVY